jgi:hypothetical protein
MENGKWKMETLPSFSVFRYPFSVDKARASASFALHQNCLRFQTSGAKPGIYNAELRISLL